MKFNRVVIAAALMGAAGVVNAGSLSWSTMATDTLENNFNIGHLSPSNALPGLVGPLAGATIDLGYLGTVGSGNTRVTITYLGSDAGHDDGVTNAILTVGTYIGAAGTQSIETRGPGVPANTVIGVPGVSSVQAIAGAGGFVPFTFADQSTLPPTEARNGDPKTWSPFTSPYSTIGLIGTNMVVGGTLYQYVIGFNDKAGGCGAAPCTTSADWNDMVIGVNAVPEPEVYAMLAAGLGLMGFVARRRKQLQSAA
jgi:hypothetical protein